ncbi:MAG TPA: penicillin-binding transpeptidase domain-containing protein [Thermoanaerobaculia bacterium]|nr:penicillin-binding transpeptidase domain-containing protein [Thermoanaerobaculia bacterium]
MKGGIKSRGLLVLLFGALWIAAIAARLVHLQIVRHEHYTDKAARQQRTAVELDPPRGTIYDAQGRELAVSVQVDSLWADPSDVKDPVGTARQLARVLGADEAALAARLQKKSDFVWLARKLDPPVAAAVRALGLEGIRFLPESKRYYPMRDLAAQVLGYVGTDNRGLGGLELVYDKQIAGRPGKRTLLRDARRGTVVAPGLAFSDPEPGGDLHLTLDATIQHIVERELAKAVEERRAKSGSMVLLDPATGAVLAMATYPSFDPNRYGDYPAARWRNRAIMDAYEPGSTFKVVTAAAALEAGLVKPTDMFDCEMGSITLLGIRIRDHKPFGRLTFAEVLAKSSNVGTIKTALLLGDERLYTTVRGFGFGRPTGIDLPGESQGILAPRESWRPLTKAYVSFGQGISVTALQLVNALGAVANDGQLLTPYVVSAMGRGEAIQKLHAAPVVAGRPISAATARELRLLLEGVVAGGTGRAAGVAGYRVGGKTGTAQKPLNGGYSRSGYVPSFFGLAPADRPVIVGVVAVDEPQGFAYHGGQVAAPIFGAVARQVLLYLGVPPERTPLVQWPGQMAIAGLAPGAPASLAPTVPVPAVPIEEAEELAPRDAIFAEPAEPAVAPAAPAAAPAVPSGVVPSSTAAEARPQTRERSHATR